MLFIGIDIASKKHDCCIIGADGEILASNFVIKNYRDGFNFLLNKIKDLCPNNYLETVKIGLESTGHYSDNLLTFLQFRNFNVTVFNPLQVNLHRKASSLRKTKTDKADAKFIATMLFVDVPKSRIPVDEQILELKSLIRHRHRLVASCSKLKVSLSRLITILFPEITEAFSTIHGASAYALFLEYPTAKAIANCHLTKLHNLLFDASKHRFSKDKAVEIKALASTSIGKKSFATGFELQQTIRIIMNNQNELGILDKQIKDTMTEIDSPILSIPGISYQCRQLNKKD